MESTSDVGVSVNVVLIDVFNIYNSNNNINELNDCHQRGLFIFIMIIMVVGSKSFSIL